MDNFNWPLMIDNITTSDRQAMINHLTNPESKLTHGPKVREFEDNWNSWLGSEFSVMVNSGSSANDLTMLALKYNLGKQKVLLPALTWVSDVASVIHSGHMPVFCDITLETLAPSLEVLDSQIDSESTIVFLTHILGLPALNGSQLEALNKKSILIEDVCESHGANSNGKKLGNFGLISNFSFYFAHHMTTMEGGMISTNSQEYYEIFRMLRSHGLVREIDQTNIRNSIIQEYPKLNPEFIFKYASHNMRPIELQGVLGLSQIERLSRNCTTRSRNFEYFLSQLDKGKFFTNFKLEGNSSYALLIVLNEPNMKLRDSLEQELKKAGIEFRRGLSGGGNQLRQPYLKYVDQKFPSPGQFPVTEHVHDFGWYVGNYPDLKESEIDRLCSILNKL